MRNSRINHKVVTETHRKQWATRLTLIAVCIIQFGCFYKTPYTIDPWYAFVSEEETIWLDQDGSFRGFINRYVPDNNVHIMARAGALKEDQSENKCAIILSLEIAGENIKRRLKFFPDSARISMNGKAMNITKSSLNIWKWHTPRAFITFQAVSVFGSCRCENGNSIEHEHCIVFDFRKTFRLDGEFLPLTLITGTFEKP